MPERIRLHISPLNPELLQALVPPSVLPTASDISYHTLQTFPDRKYGYIELPAMEAEKIKKKFNGSILKGHRVRVEEARSKEKTKRSRERDAVDEAGEEHTAKKARKSKAKQKPGDGVLPGYELPESRKVKRGWTESKADKTTIPKKGRKEKKAKAKASSLTGQPECLFRTTVPPTAAKAPEVTSVSRSAAKLNKKGKSSQEVVVHEFSNTTKHGNFLRENQVTRGEKSISEYVDGKGWVDKNGDVVEAEPLTHRPRLKPKEITAATYNNKTIFSGDVSNSSQRDSSPEDQHPKLVISSSHHEVDDETSSSGTSSSSDSESEDIVEVSKALGEPITSAEASDEASISSSGSDKTTEEKFEESNSATWSTSRSASSMSLDKEANATPKADDTNTEAGTETKEVHPLEALFKRPQGTASSTPRKPTLEVRTSFSFFDPDAANETSSHLTIPQTPFTQRDIQDRRLRSAAPTPDTAAPGKTFGNIWAGHPDNEEAGDDDDEEELAQPDLSSTPLAGKGSAPNEDEKGKPPESDFAKWFWEHRGETNRAWKKRRREAAKEQRQRENRRRGRSGI